MLGKTRPARSILPTRVPSIAEWESFSGPTLLSPRSTAALARMPWAPTTLMPLLRSMTYTLRRLRQLTHVSSLYCATSRRGLDCRSNEQAMRQRRECWLFALHGTAPNGADLVWSALLWVCIAVHTYRHSKFGPNGCMHEKHVQHRACTEPILASIVDFS